MTRLVSATPYDALARNRRPSDERVLTNLVGMRYDNCQ